MERESFGVYKIPRVTASRALCGGDQQTWGPLLMRLPQSLIVSHSPVRVMLLPSVPSQE